MSSDGDLLTRRVLLELMERHGLEPHRTLGQNYVVDANTIRRIVRLADVSVGEHVLEIGSGLGSLTLGLLAAGAVVTAVEIDQRVVAAFTDVTGGRATLVVGDAMELDLEAVTETGSLVVANLPYNVATPLVLRVLDEVPSVQRLLVMVQREVGERWAAGAGDSQRGIPSVRVEWWATARVVGSVSAEVFHPRPKVASVLVEITRRIDVPDVPLSSFIRLVRTAFGQRRKMLRRSLDGVVSADAFTAANVDSSARPEVLTLHDWVNLTRAVAPV